MASTAFVFGLAGFSGSGKTTLMCKILPLMTKLGLQVSTIKHAHHAFDVDQPGKDSYRHRESGAQETIIASANRWALMHENRDMPEPTLNQLLQHMSAVDIVMVEGYKAENFPKIFVHRKEFNGNIVADDLSGFCDIIAVATDTPSAIDTTINLPILEINAPQDIVDFILKQRT